MTESEDMEAFDEQLAALEQSMGGAQSMTAELASELTKMKSSLTDTSREVKGLSSGLSSGLKNALSDLVLDGVSLRTALGTIGRSVADKAFSAAVNPVTKGLGDMVASGVSGMLSGAAFAKGAGFAQGRVMPFANGGVVSGATVFPMRGGLGLMGEAGSEAIMPLSRGSDGKLGVRSDGGGRPVNVTMNVTTPDVQGFRRSHSQIATQMSRMLARGERNR